MRRTVLLFSLSSILVTAQAAESVPDFNFEELMEGVELNLNEMQASISLQDKEDAIKRSGEIKDSFHKIELFFASWGYAEDAVASAKEYQQRSDRIVELIKAEDFNAAYDVSVEHSDHCKACHDNYKPL
jgi:hypothetical protein